MKLSIFAILIYVAGYSFFTIGWCAEDVYTDALTRKTVDFVASAVKMIEKDGEKAFFEFNKDGSPWRKDASFMVFDTAGTLFVYHDFSRLGEDVKKLPDGNGKAYMAEAISDISSGKVSTWMPYTVENPRELPSWRVYFLMSAVSPSGKLYIAGTDIANIPPEKEITKNIVEAYFKRSAAEKDLFSAAAKKARASASFPGTDIFAFSPDFMKGLDSRSEEYSIMNHTDSGGNYTSRNAVTVLPEKYSAWIDYEWLKPGEKAPSKRTAYIKKIYLNGKTTIIGAGRDR